MVAKTRRMARLLTALLASSVTLVTTMTASANTILFANITNQQENPAINTGLPGAPTTTTAIGNLPRPASFGTATFNLNDAQTSMTFSATIFNIDFTGTQTPDVNDNLLNAHIHAGAGVTATTNGSVVWGFIGSPFNDNNPNDMVLTPFTTGVGGTVSGKWDAPEGNNTTLAAQLPFILSGRSYINFHTTQFTGGEIRGALIPEPSTFLVGLGLSAVIGLRRRRTA